MYALAADCLLIKQIDHAIEAVAAGGLAIAAFALIRRSIHNGDKKRQPKYRHPLALLLSPAVGASTHL